MTESSNNGSVVTNVSRKRRRKQELLTPHLEGDILHIGCIGAGIETRPGWLHGWLDEQAKNVVGIDINKEELEAARKSGYDCRYGDAEQFELDREFDVVVATNVIEHLLCPGAMLARANKHLADDGKLLLTTPRTFTAQNLLREVRGGIEPNEGHVAWYCRGTLGNLLARESFEITEYERWGWDRVGASRADHLYRSVERRFEWIPVVDRLTDYQHFVVASPVQAMKAE